MKRRSNGDPKFALKISKWDNRVYQITSYTPKKRKEKKKVRRFRKKMQINRPRGMHLDLFA